MPTIYHITTAAQWAEAQQAGSYAGDTLATEGFIHCSLPAQVQQVANAFFRGRQGLVLLRIDEARVAAEVRHEASPDHALPFPHIYGPLNADAVVGAEPFEPGADGAFRF